MFSLSPSISLSPSYKMQWHMKNKACCNCVNAKLEEKIRQAKERPRFICDRCRANLMRKTYFICLHTHHTHNIRACAIAKRVAIFNGSFSFSLIPSSCSRNLLQTSIHAVRARMLTSPHTTAREAGALLCVSSSFFVSLPIAL